MSEKQGGAGRPGGTPKPTRGGGKRGGTRVNMLWVYLGLTLGALLLIKYFYGGPEKQETNWQEVRNSMLEKGYVSKLCGIRNKGIVEVYLTQEGLEYYADRLGGTKGYTANKPAFYFTIGSVETFEKQLAEAQESVPEEKRIYPEYEERVDYLVNILTWIFPFVLLIALWMFMFRRVGSGGGANGGIFNVGKSKARLFNKQEHVKVDFKDVAGMEEAKVEVREIVDFLKNPRKYTELGGKIPKGAILVGPPGTGKTLLAKAVAGEANVPFFSLSGSDFVEMFVGVGASRVRDLFQQAKEKAPCIIFIDEIDAIGRTRSKNVGFSSSEERENTLNQLLTEMDGFSTNQGVIVLAATNRADILDGALLRAGRFDRQIHVELPDYPERYDIFKVHLKPLKLAPDFDHKFLAKQTPGFSGADIANVCNEAALIAARNNRKAVEKQDFLDAVDRIVGGLERKNKLMSDEEKRRIAYHEAGHATVSWMLDGASPLLKVSIIPRGRSLGAAWYVPEERQITTKGQMEDEMAAILAGRASEEVVFGEISTGALNDLERANQMAYSMVAYFGMMDGDMRNVCYYDSSGRSEYSFSKPFSEQTAEKIDKSVKTLIDEAYERAKAILRENREGLDQLVSKLLTEEVIFANDVQEIYGPRKKPLFPELDNEDECIPNKDETMVGDDKEKLTTESSVESTRGDGAKHLGSVGKAGGAGDLRMGGVVRGTGDDASLSIAENEARAQSGEKASTSGDASSGQRKEGVKHLGSVGKAGGAGDLRMGGVVRGEHESNAPSDETK